MESERVRQYFDRTAEEFDHLYDSSNRLFRLFNRLFRSDIERRFRLTFETCQPLPGARVLDVGCGSGRYMTNFAQRGAQKVVGVDMSQKMIDLAEMRCREAGVERLCAFLCGDFHYLELPETFDFVIALGVFDYIRDPVPLLERMKQAAHGTIVASFPKKARLRSLQRKLRYRLRGCPVYFYTEGDVQSILRNAGIERYSLVNLQAGYFVSATVAHG